MLNASGIQSHGVVGAQIEVLNTLSQDVSFSELVHNQNISKWNGDDQICGYNPTYSLIGFAVFAGDFSAGNISAAGSPLKLAPPFYPPCTASIAPRNVTFFPLSDQAIASNNMNQTQTFSYLVTAVANATTRYCAFSGASANCGESPGLVGYWNYSIPMGGDGNFTSQAFVYFPEGVYTVVATDDWNQYVYATFAVL